MIDKSTFGCVVWGGVEVSGDVVEIGFSSGFG